MQLCVVLSLNLGLTYVLFFVILVYNGRNGHKKYIFHEKYILKARMRVSAKIHY